MKALKKAEHTQKGSLNPDAKGNTALGDELTLAPMTSAGMPHDTRNDVRQKQSASTSNAIQNQAAANLFQAKHHQNKSWLALIVAIGAILIAGGGIYLYFQLSVPASITPLTHPPMAPTSAVVLPQNTAPAPQAEPVTQTTGPLLSEIEERQKAHTKAAKSDSVTRTEDGIKITQESTSFTINPALANAYQTLREGRTDLALSQYQRILSAEPNNIDALLGLASIAAKQGRAEQSAKYYVRVLELDPKNAAAQAGLIGFMGKTDPASSEFRLKQLLQNQPAAFLFFALGNLHAGQSLWPSAEQAYFQAFQMEPGNPDYAFNLAVSLEHLNQTRQALSFYQQTLKLMQANGSTHFDKRVLLERINQLSSTTPHDIEDTK